MRTQDLEVCGDSFVLENTRNALRNPKKRVGRYCGTYTGKVTEIPIFTLPLHHSETSGVAPGGERRLLAVSLQIAGTFGGGFLQLLPNQFLSNLCFSRFSDLKAMFALQVEK